MKTKTQIELRIAQIRHYAEGLRLTRQELLMEKNKKHKGRCIALLESWNIAMFQVESLMWVIEPVTAKKKKS